MSTADTINSIRTHLTEDYEGLENLGVTAEDRNIENIRTCLDELYNNIPKTTDTGTNLSLNTIKGKMNITPKGDTQQDTYSGKNLYPSGTSIQTLGGITFTPQENGSIKLKGTSAYANYYVAGADSQYVEVANISNIAEEVTLSVSGMQDGIQVYVVGSRLGAKGIANSDGTLTFTTIANDTYRIFIRVAADYSVDTTLYIQLEKGSSATSFEKYVGGTASPNPSYPQDIEVVRGKNRLQLENGTNTTYNVTAVTENGKITLNGAPNSNTYSRLISTFTANTTDIFTLSPNKSATNSDIRLLYTINDGSLINSDNTPQINLTIGDILKVYLRISSTSQITNFTLQPQLEKGSQATSYLPFNTIEVKARGKNVVDWNNIPYTGQNGASVTKADSEYSVTCASSQFGFAQFTQENLKLKPNTNYIFRAKIKSTSVEAGSVIRINPYMSATGYEMYSNRATSGNIAKITFTTPSTIPSNAAVGLYPYKANESAVYTDIMICEGTDDTYEPYVTPQIKQLSLGDIELCKIGNYQDYLYKSGDKWYKKEILYKIANKTNWVVGNMASNNRAVFGLVANGFLSAVNIYSGINCISNSFIAVSQGTQGTTTEINNICINGSNMYIKFADTINTRELAKAQLDSMTSFIAYYILATPNDIEITNETLIDQLNNLEKMKSYNGTTNISSNGNLPMVLGVSALKGE